MDSPDNKDHLQIIRSKMEFASIKTTRKSAYKMQGPAGLRLISLALLSIIVLELLLINPQLSRPVEAKKKKKIIKKIKEILPLIALLKRKKIVLLPIPM